VIVFTHILTSTGEYQEKLTTEKENIKKKVQEEIKQQKAKKIIGQAQEDFWERVASEFKETQRRKI
jgi:hypothetical protein